MKSKVPRGPKLGIDQNRTRRALIQGPPSPFGVSASGLPLVEPDSGSTVSGWTSLRTFSRRGSKRMCPFPHGLKIYPFRTSAQIWIYLHKEGAFKSFVNICPPFKDKHFLLGNHAVRSLQRFLQSISVFLGGAGGRGASCFLITRAAEP